MSPSFPYSGVDAVVAIRYAVTTHDRWLIPPRSPTVVGRAVETIVWSRAARRIPRTRAAKIGRRCLGIETAAYPFETTPSHLRAAPLRIRSRGAASSWPADARGRAEPRLPGRAAEAERPLCA